jgi:hypothetical protein
MLEWLKPKKRTFTEGLDTVVTDERVDVEHKSTGRTYSFNIGSTTDGKWFALTDETQKPKFCFEAVDRDDAYARGVEALNFYFKHLDTEGL